MYGFTRRLTERFNIDVRGVHSKIILFHNWYNKNPKFFVTTFVASCAQIGQAGSHDCKTCASSELRFDIKKDLRELYN